MRIEAMRRAFGDAVFTAKEAAEVLALDDASSALSRLKQAGAIERVSRGVYRFADTQRVLAVERALERQHLASTRREADRTIAALAARAWRSWLDTGFVATVGPRHLRLRPRTPGVRPRVRRR